MAKRKERGANRVVVVVGEGGGVRSNGCRSDAFTDHLAIYCPVSGKMYWSVIEHDEREEERKGRKEIN